jgi:hypothetical protein
VITTAFVSILCFGGHIYNGQHFIKLKGYLARMLASSVLQQTSPAGGLCASTFLYRVKGLMGIAVAATYRLDFFPVAACNNTRIKCSRIL